MGLLSIFPYLRCSTFGSDGQSPKSLNLRKAHPEFTESTVTVSYLEIYNEADRTRALVGTFLRTPVSPLCSG